MLTSENVPYLSEANFVGEGFDILGKYDVVSSAITPLLDPAKASYTTFNFLGHEYVVPSYILAAEDTQAYYNEFAGETRDSFQNSLAEHAQVQGSYGAFSGQMEQAYSKQFASNSEYSYAYRNFFSRLALLQLIPDSLDQYVTDLFQQRVSQLPKSVTSENVHLFADFFDDFGMYFTSEITLGGSLEYYVAVDRTSQMSTTDISASVKIDYNAVFWSAGVSAAAKSTQNWQNYSSNRSVNIAAKGGDSTLLAKLTSVDPDQPSAQSVSIYNQWLDSINTNPSITDFKLRGIWELCGDKKAVVEEAFQVYGSSMRPRLVVEVSSDSGKVPIITLGSDIRPSAGPQFPQGYQMVVIDRSDPSATGIRLNRYYSFSLDYPFYQNATRMYDQMLSDLKDGSFDNVRYCVVVASFGFDRDAPPSSSFYGFMRAAGGGQQLQRWVENSDPGSSYKWPAVYSLTGIPNVGPGTGFEIYADSINGNSILKTLEVLFYRQQNNSLFSLGAGDSST